MIQFGTMGHERILIVEVDLAARRALESELQAEGYQVVGVSTANEAMHAAREKKPDLMVLDLNLVTDCDLNGIIDGFSLLAWMRYNLADTNFQAIIHAEDPSPEIDSRAMTSQAYAVWRKGDLPGLVSCIRQALKEQEAASSVH